jgi:hypothetical protein
MRRILKYLVIVPLDLPERQCPVTALIRPAFYVSGNLIACPRVRLAMAKREL